MIRLIFTFLLSLTFLISYSQCEGNISYTVDVPPGPGNTYPPGSVVQLCITMDGWNGNAQGSNWFEGFFIALGGGWETVTPTLFPEDAESASGTWLWMTSVTSDNGAVGGNGFYFEGPSGPEDGNPGNDWGDSCPSTTCVWTCCVELVAANGPSGLDLHIGVIPYSDGTMGSWGIQSCNETQTVLFEGSIGCFVPGCIDPAACNYNANADCDNGSCNYGGCTDPIACNYDLNAACDDGTCTYGGCTDPLACNFNPLAGCNDGSCDYFSMGEITPSFSTPSDTICVGLEIIYSVDGNPNSTYNWNVEGGEIILPDQSNECKILWGNIPGTYTITAQETTESGCVGPIETYEVIVASPDITFDSSYQICYNQSVQLSANPPGGSWSGQYVNGDVFIGYEPGVSWPTYTVEIYGCTLQESIDVTVYPVYQGPLIIYDDLFVDMCLSDGQRAYYATDNRSESYHWSLDGTLISNGSGSLSINWPDTTQTHLLSVYGMDQGGCLSGTTPINVQVQTCHRIYIPNSFSPNGDGVNDVFGLYGVGIYDPKLVVYNRWGNPVFETTDTIEVWTGDNGAGYYSEAGAYNWKVYYKDNEGFKREKSGVVLLIR